MTEVPEGKFGAGINTNYPPSLDTKNIGIISSLKADGIWSLSAFLWLGHLDNSSAQNFLGRLWLFSRINQTVCANEICYNN
jgi:hypothetical protein